jgi:membrane-bound lytic murein transglycosylase D
MGLGRNLLWGEILSTFVDRQQCSQVPFFFLKRGAFVAATTAIAAVTATNPALRGFRPPAYAGGPERILRSAAPIPRAAGPRLRGETETRRAKTASQPITKHVPLTVFLAALAFFYAVSTLGAEERPLEYILLPEPAQEVTAVAENAFDRPLRRYQDVREEGRFWLPNAEEVKPSIEGLDQERSLSFIDRYGKGGNKTWILDSLARGGIYMAFIKTRLQEENVPEEFLYLPVVESAFVSTVVSRSGAAGLWQFMRNSMAPWLTSSDWLDERLDFWASTNAAIAKLKSNYEETKDWPLALAAYNSGLGAIRSVLKKHPGKDYWELSALNALKSETLYYVPKLLAVYYLVSNPRRTGFEDFWPGWVEWEQVTVGRQADLGVLAEIAGIDAGELRRGNAELHYNTTPPDPNYKLKVRAELKDQVDAAIAQAEFPLLRNYIHIVEKGDTVYALSRSYGVPQDRIFEANPGLQAKALKIGQRLLIPSLKRN